MTMCDANQSCDNLVALLRDTGLNFLVQETPFSVFITIRKSFYREVKKTGCVTENLEKLKNENSTLKTDLEDKELQLQVCRNEIIALQSRLEKAEKEMLCHAKNAKISDEKSKDEISILRSVVKKNEDMISSLKSKSSESAKSIKAYEKDIHNLHKKNENLNEQVANLKASNNEIKREKAKEIKALKTKMQIASKSKSTQTLSTLPSCSCQGLNVLLLNNNNPVTPSVVSTSTSTQTCSSFSAATVPAVSTSSSRASNLIQCVVCSEMFYTAEELIKHAGTEHDLSMNAEKLTDPNEDDAFLRFLRSMNIGEMYLKERVRYYPENSDHIFERIKIRIIAQMKFTSWSIAIERNMKENCIKKSRHRGMNHEA